MKRKDMNPDNMKPEDMNPKATDMGAESHEPRENLSSFMDGEVEKSAGSFLVRRLATDSALRATWDRYHMIRDCLRQQDAELVHADLCSRVRQAIDLEDQQQPVAARHVAWIKPFAGVAIAASVAMFAVFSVGPAQQEGPAAALQAPAMAVQSEPFVSPNIGAIIPASQPVNLAGNRTSDDEKAKAYLLRHYQLTGDAGGQGFVALVPIVATSQSAMSDEDDPEVMASRLESETTE